ncbi:MAG: sodium:alanine symporter, partial [Planococcus sp. (in: Bacteria)]|nr:sodium:alanine symporter [Planococcus sp. (in: firmicutes)]
PVLRVLKDYEQQKKEGKDPIFDPAKLGFDDADFWESEYDGELILDESNPKSESL